MLTDLDTTICAVATPPGVGAIGIVRVSGPRAFEIVDGVFRRSGEGGSQTRPYSVAAEDGATRFHSADSIVELPGYVIRHGHIVDPKAGEIIDEVLISVFRAPKSYTGEDAIEIGCHGGPVVLARIQSLLIEHGCVEARPGEFTLRAFINGRIDLTRAEGIAELIAAKTEASSQAALDLMTGALAAFIEPIREEIIRARTRLELTIDFTEEDIDPDEIADVKSALIELTARLEAMSRTYDRGRVLQDGFKVVLAGPPNSGKSTLFNRLAKDDRAIVTAIPGTTRDTLTEYINLEGVPICLIDTAGLRATEDVVERAGVERARNAAEHADLILWLSSPDTGGLPAAPPPELSGYAAPTWPVGSKSDMECGDSGSIAASRNGWSHDSLSLSATTGAGLEELLAAVASAATGRVGTDGTHVLCINDRHRRLIAGAITALGDAQSGIDSGQPSELVAEDLKSAGDRLGEIVGDITSDDVLSSIFSQFCIGK